VDDVQGGVEPDPNEPPALQDWNAELGWMLYDMDFTQQPPQPQFFRALVERGTVNLMKAEVRG
jgi:hypothetical protein